MFTESGELKARQLIRTKDFFLADHKECGDK